MFSCFKVFIKHWQSKLPPLLSANCLPSGEHAPTHHQLVRHGDLRAQVAEAERLWRVHVHGHQQARRSGVEFHVDRVKDFRGQFAEVHVAVEGRGGSGGRAVGASGRGFSAVAAILSFSTSKVIIVGEFSHSQSWSN